MAVFRRIWDGFRAWPRWAQWTAGIFSVLLLIGVAGGGGDEADKPPPLVGDSRTTAQPAITASPTTAARIDTPAPSRCQAVDVWNRSLVDGLQAGATSVRKATAVPLSAAIGSFRFIVAAEIDGPGALSGDGQVGAWGVSSLDGGGLVFSLDANAQRYSDYGGAATAGSPADRLRNEVASRPEVAAAKACVG